MNLIFKLALLGTLVLVVLMAVGWLAWWLLRLVIWMADQEDQS